MTWRLSEAGLLINQQSYGQSQRPLGDAFVRDNFWPDTEIAVADWVAENLPFNFHQIKKSKCNGYPSWSIFGRRGVALAA